MKNFLTKGLIVIACLIFGCKGKDKVQQDPATNFRTTGSIERIDPALDSIITDNAKIDVIAEGFNWSEGPLWIEHDSMLLFSDVPTNIIYKWTEKAGKSIYLQPSGFTGTDSSGKTQGSNGLVIDSEGRLVICQHGDRRIARMDAPLDAPAAKFITVTDRYNGNRYSSPNDAVYYFDDLYFTDPPFGLPRQADDSAKEISFNGVYRMTKAGVVSVIADSLARPNGLAFFPGNQKLLVANCDPEKPNWYLYDLGPDDTIATSRIFFSAAGYDKNLPGLPDGLKIDAKGNVFATGPGGVYIINKDGKLLGKIKLDKAASNCALSGDEKTLYITNHKDVLRIKMR